MTWDSFVLNQFRSSIDLSLNESIEGNEKAYLFCCDFTLVWTWTVTAFHRQHISTLTILGYILYLLLSYWINQFSTIWNRLRASILKLFHDSADWVLGVESSSWRRTMNHCQGFQLENTDLKKKQGPNTIFYTLSQFYCSMFPFEVSDVFDMVSCFLIQIIIKFGVFWNRFVDYYFNSNISTYIW